jgi:hypothetical protein
MRAPCSYLVALLIASLADVAYAQPGPATLIAPGSDVVGSTIAFTWQSAPTATWYQFWLGKADASLVLDQWYTAEHAGCALGGTCSITLTPPIKAGAFVWHIRPWAPTGYGPWSAAHMFTLKDVVQAWSGLLPPSRRFTLVLNSEGVLDNETGLVWQRSVNATGRTLSAAILYCGNLNAGGRFGWRIPTHAELKGLVDSTVAGVPLPPGHPFTIPGFIPYHWTSTRVGNDYLGVRFGDGGTGSIAADATINVWCVRGGPGS